jgi:hypothetical protein
VAHSGCEPSPPNRLKSIRRAARSYRFIHRPLRTIRMAPCHGDSLACQVRVFSGSILRDPTGALIPEERQEIPGKAGKPGAAARWGKKRTTEST